eukprot:TRINITY_DN8647_c0_g1_i1.p1 TRINITY_DN8647_c0_g1~~TRINITY_DN8647_c0_g1_i1.p1  ORF type:complete len:530 (+),score=104.12 TRINITY_DN8647_c0_g1_i1:423-2012(+)
MYLSAVVWCLLGCLVAAHRPDATARWKAKVPSLNSLVARSGGGASSAAAGTSDEAVHSASARSIQGHGGDEAHTGQPDRAPGSLLETQQATLHGADAEAASRFRRAAERDMLLESIRLHAGGGGGPSEASEEACADPRIHLVGESRPQALTNLQWLHIPKAGTSFIASLWSYACDHGPDAIDLAVDVTFAPTGCERCYDFSLMDRYPRAAYCQAGSLSEHFQTQHRPTNSELLDEENVVGFFRRPSQRLISAFHDGLHANGFSTDTERELFKACHEAGPSCFVRFPGIAGCMTRMLTGQRCARDVRKEGSETVTTAEPQFSLSQLLPSSVREALHWNTDPAVADAIANIQKLRFVGLTEDWDESICLFHLMFGGRLRAEEFKDIHTTRNSNASLYDEAVLDGFVDEQDEAVYDAAKARFEELRRQYIGEAASLCEAALGNGGTSRLRDAAAGSHCSCAAAGAECGRGSAAARDCGDCPSHRLPAELGEAAKETLSCAQQLCHVAGQRQPQLFTWGNWSAREVATSSPAS